MEKESLVKFKYEGIIYPLSNEEVNMLNKILEYDVSNHNLNYGSKVKLLFKLKGGDEVVGTILECERLHLFPVCDVYIPEVLKISTSTGVTVVKFFQIESFRDENHPLISYKSV